jgi:hypothetical protein
VLHNGSEVINYDFIFSVDRESQAPIWMHKANLVWKWHM